MVAELQRLGRVRMDHAGGELGGRRRITEHVVQLVWRITPAEPRPALALGMKAAIAVDPAIGLGAGEEVRLIRLWMRSVPEAGGVPVSSDQESAALDAATLDGVRDIGM